VVQHKTLDLVAPQGERYYVIGTLSPPWAIMSSTTIIFSISVLSYQTFFLIRAFVIIMVRSLCNSKASTNSIFSNTAIKKLVGLTWQG
jgi:hypothetical protein